MSEVVAFLGLGAMGSRMAANLLTAGYRVVVWNRTPAAAETLLTAGAVWADSPRAAAAGADFVIAMVRDDAASRRVWLDPTDGALAGMSAGAVAIDSSTLSPAWVKSLGEHAQASGVALLEAPVSGSRLQAEAGQLVYFVGGDEAVAQRAGRLLGSMGTAAHFVGALGSAALTKLTTNALLGVQVSALAELIGLLRRQGCDPARIFDAVAGTAVSSPFARGAVQGMLGEQFAPQFPVDLIAKDFAYVLGLAAAPVELPTLAAVRQVFERGLAEGLGPLNMTSVVRLFGSA